MNCLEWFLEVVPSTWGRGAVEKKRITDHANSEGDEPTGLFDLLPLLKIKQLFAQNLSLIMQNET